MKLLISPKYGEKASTVRLIETARNVGIHTNTLLNSWDTNKESGMYNGVHERTAVYGEHAFCEFIAQELKLNLHSNSLDWTSKLHHAFLKRKVSYTSLDNIISASSERRHTLASKVFEPADDASFNIGVYNGRLPGVPLNTKILIHDDVDWKIKYRFLIVNNEITTFCCFKVATTFNTPTIYETKFYGKNMTADTFVKSLLKHYNTAPACILDVGFIDKLGWGVCGTYPVWVSEPYGLNPLKFLEALFVSCVAA